MKQYTLYVNGFCPALVLNQLNISETLIIRSLPKLRIKSRRHKPVLT
ncbi:hypothetical protein KL86DYS1_10713 [uncultured Dysgonomonas sp.]|uniref:Uncharacterized protein n=1 Tax=uncultured Dysgonomonas sp. TaxID=206096 RepID=A0A212J050_9BACT|nr:hypothetical protein KL86DYS1_10713 [uncultured Dysgonomonas sp.]